MPATPTGSDFVREWISSRANSRPGSQVSQAILASLGDEGIDEAKLLKRLREISAVPKPKVGK